MGNVLRVVLHGVRLHPRRRDRISRPGVREHQLPQSSISMRTPRRRLEERTDLAGDGIVRRIPVAVDRAAAPAAQVGEREPPKIAELDVGTADIVWRCSRALSLYDVDIRITPTGRQA